VEEQLSKVKGIRQGKVISLLYSAGGCFLGTGLRIVLNIMVPVWKTLNILVFTTCMYSKKMKYFD